jgi:hypothetical protein
MGLGALQGESLSFDPEVSGPKGRMNPAHAGLSCRQESLKHLAFRINLTGNRVGQAGAPVCELFNM